MEPRAARQASLAGGGERPCRPKAGAVPDRLGWITGSAVTASAATRVSRDSPRCGELAAPASLAEAGGVRFCRRMLMPPRPAMRPTNSRPGDAGGKAAAPRVAALWGDAEVSFAGDRGDGGGCCPPPGDGSSVVTRGPGCGCVLPLLPPQAALFMAHMVCGCTSRGRLSARIESFGKLPSHRCSGPRFAGIAPGVHCFLDK